MCYLQLLFSVWLDSISRNSAFLQKDFRFCPFISISSFNPFMTSASVVKALISFYNSTTFLNKPYPFIQLNTFLHSFVDIVWICVPVNCFETTLLEWILSLHLNPADTGVNWTYIRRSEDLLDVFWTSYVRSIYVLCLRGNIFYYCSIAPEGFLKALAVCDDKVNCLEFAAGSKD